jgi:hypothetical protein
VRSKRAVAVHGRERAHAAFEAVGRAVLFQRDTSLLDHNRLNRLLEPRHLDLTHQVTHQISAAFIRVRKILELGFHSIHLLCIRFDEQSACQHTLRGRRCDQQTPARRLLELLKILIPRVRARAFDNCHA